MRINTTISSIVNVWDINGNWVPMGNYYFLIKKINNRGQVTGILSNKHFKGKFTFECKDVFKMMAIGQARLARRCGIGNEQGMPSYPSPSTSPTNHYPNVFDFNVLSEQNNNMGIFNSSGESTLSVNNDVNTREIKNEIVEDNNVENYSAKDYELNRESLRLQRNILMSISENNIALKEKEKEKKEKEKEKKEKEEENKCMICLVPIKKQIKVLPCAHKFHSFCIDRWINLKSNCPICRQSVNSSVTTTSSNRNRNRRGRRARTSNEYGRYSSLPRVNTNSRFQVINEGMNSYNSVLNEARRIIRNNYRL